MIKTLFKLWINHIRDHIVLYVITIFMFLAGSSLGAFAVSTLTAFQLQELVDYFNYFLTGFTYWDVSSSIVVQDAIFNSLIFIFSTWILGLTVIGIPIILLIVVFKGFIMGFTVGFLIFQKGFTGMLIAIFAVLPQNFFYVPGLIICAVVAITFSLSLLRGTIDGRKFSFSHMFVNYILLLVVFCFLTVIGGLIEGYVAPITMQIIITYF